MRGMRALQDIGLIDEVGVSNYSLVRWCTAETALGRRVLSNQVRFNLLTREPAEQMVPFAAEAGRVVIAYSPLEQGLLSGRYTAEHRPTGGVRVLNPLFLPENLERIGPLLGVLRDVAAAHDATPAQIALAWVVHHPHVVAIPGASSVAQLEQNAAAADLVLRDDEVTALTAAAQAYQPIRSLNAARSLATELWRRRP
jgi:aryl-alcohol dehydrogenase-like predicted oxidoreductase